MLPRRGRDSALRRDRVTARGKYLGQTGCREAGLGEAERGAQARASRTDDHHVIAVVDQFV